MTKKGKKQSQELIKKRVESRRGYKHSEKTKRKISLARKGKKLSKEHKKKISLGMLASEKFKIVMASSEHRKRSSISKLGTKNPMWKGDKVGYAGIHKWITRRFPRTKKCQNCKKVSPYDLANIGGEYKRDLSDWKWLCRRCHMIEDGRMKNLIKTGIINCRNYNLNRQKGGYCE